MSGVARQVESSEKVEEEGLSTTTIVIIVIVILIILGVSGYFLYRYYSNSSEYEIEYDEGIEYDDYEYEYE